MLQRINALVTGCVGLGVPVVRIFHVDPPETPSNLFAFAWRRMRARRREGGPEPAS